MLKKFKEYKIYLNKGKFVVSAYRILRLFMMPSY